MLNDVLRAMSKDMNIKRYKSETDISYSYRLVYSALGQWCLRSASSPNNPITKHAQSLLLNNILDGFLFSFPELNDSFHSDEQNNTVSVFIRRVYEETRYLITTSDNRNIIADIDRGINIGDKHLFFGLRKPIFIAGLGVFVENNNFPITWREALILDNLTWEQYLSSQFDIVLFSERDITAEELQFFNPKSSNSPSSSWESHMTTEESIARKTPDGPFFKVKKVDNKFFYCEMMQNENKDNLTSYEYRRLYFALKHFYQKPIEARIKKLDDEYSEITIKGHLPNREYYLLLLCSWPDMVFTNKYKFIIKNIFIDFVTEVLNNIAIEVKGA